MSKLRAILADDEVNLLRYLQEMLNRLWPELEVVAKATNGMEALGLIRDEEPDIAFLDIRMPVLNGIQVANRVQGECHIVFITAYDEYAIDAFESAAIDYLLKPVEEQRLAQTIERLKKFVSGENTASDNLTKLIEQLTQRSGDRPPEYLGWIRAGAGEETHMVAVDDVIYFKAEDKYTSVVTLEKAYLIRKPIRELVGELNPEQFWQVHRSIVVQIEKIDRLKKALNGTYTLQLKGISDALTVSRRYAHLFRQM